MSIDPMIARGRNVFAQYCAPCHGAGRGDDGAPMLPGWPTRRSADLDEHARGDSFMKARHVLGLGLCSLLAACGQSEQPLESDYEADVAAIAQVNERLLGALNSGAWARLNELTDPSYVAIIGGRAIQGKEQLDAANQRFLQQWQDEEQWLPDETIVDGDLAFQRGSFTMTLIPRQDGGAARDLVGTYLHIYQRKPDGSWALTRAMAGESAGEAAGP